MAWPIRGEVFEVERLSLKHVGGANASVESVWIGNSGSGEDGASILLTVTLKHAEVSNGLVKYTWNANVQNNTDEALHLSLTLILTDQADEVVRASTIEAAFIPAKATAGFTQSEPVKRSDWDEVVEHEISVVSD